VKSLQCLQGFQAHDASPLFSCQFPRRGIALFPRPRYVILYNSGAPAEIAKGEEVGQEFKSTLRWNIRAGKNDDAMTHAVLKTIAGFANSDGGRLYIGVADNGEILGLDDDGFDNLDKYALHLTNLIKDTMGSTTAAEVKLQFPAIRGKHVCRVECPRAKAPVYLKFKGNEEFFVRTGPSTTKLTPSDLVEYVSKHFSCAVPRMSH
jgi:predicted HTH transcriptional regulator